MSRFAALAGTLLAAGQLIAVPLTFEQRSSTLFASPTSAIRIEPKQISVDTLKFRFAGASDLSALTPIGPSAPITYFSAGHRRSLRQYTRIAIRHLYPGIDAVFYGNEGHLEYDLILEPGASPRHVRMVFDNGTRLHIAPNGDLIAEAGTHSITQCRPRALQSDGTPVDVRYILQSGNVASLRLGPWNRNLPLTIDPEVISSTTFAAGTRFTRIATDAQGNLYVSGSGASPDDPPNTSRIFVAKLDPAGTQILATAFLGGSSTSVASLKIDNNGNWIVAGASGLDYPSTTRFGPPPSMSNPGVAFVTMLSSDGSQLIYSSVISGVKQVYLAGLALDASGSPYIAGWVTGNDFLTTAGAFQPLPLTPQCGTDQVSNGYVAKLAQDGTGFEWATYLTGSCGSQTAAISVGPQGNIVVAGVTSSQDFPVSPTAFRPAPNGPPTSGYQTSALPTGFVTSLSPSGDRLIAGTFVGPGSMAPSALTLDPSGNIYLTGRSSDLTPGTDGAYTYMTTPACSYQPQSSQHFPWIYFGVFIEKFDPDLTTLAFRNFIQGNCGEASTGIAVDPDANLWLIGVTESAGFPLKSPYQMFGPSASFIVEISADGSQLLFSTSTDANALVIAPSGDVFAAGTQSNFPVSPVQRGEVLRLNPLDPAGPAIDDIVPVTAYPQSLLGLAPFSFRSIALGELVSIRGARFGAAATILAQPDSGRYPTTLAGITVSFDGVAAPLLSVSDNEIVCVTPFAIDASAQTHVSVDSSGSPSNSVANSVVKSAPQIVSIVNADGTLNSADHPAVIGSTIRIYASGFRTYPPLVDGLVNDGTPLRIDQQFSLSDSLGRPTAVYTAPGLPAGILTLEVTVGPPQVPGDSYRIDLNNTEIIYDANNSTATLFVAPQ